MTEPFTILIVIALVAIAAVVFAMWLFLTVLKLGLRAIVGICTALWWIATGKPARPGTVQPNRGVRQLSKLCCSNEKCRSPLPVGARFCVRCGTSTMTLVNRVA
jgi:hypothetical protein